MQFNVVIAELLRKGAVAVLDVDVRRFVTLVAEEEETIPLRAHGQMRPRHYPVFGSSVFTDCSLADRPRQPSTTPRVPGC